MFTSATAPPRVHAATARIDWYARDACGPRKTSLIISMIAAALKIAAGMTGQKSAMVKTGMFIACPPAQPGEAAPATESAAARPRPWAAGPGTCGRPERSARAAPAAAGPRRAAAQAAAWARAERRRFPAAAG